jgi:large subunit ribosomal protein L11
VREAGHGRTALPKEGQAWPRKFRPTSSCKYRLERPIRRRRSGPRSVNIMEFCKQFNARTQKMEAGMPIPVVITVFQDRSFAFVTKTPPVTYFLKKAAGIESGAKTVGTQIVGKVTKKQVEEIAKQKMPDLNCDSVESAMAQVVGSARSMGLQVVE